MASLLPARAVEYFVSGMGSDSASGTDLHQPLLTIQHGAEVAGPGDTVTVLDGVYKESMTITHSGAKGAPILIRSLKKCGALGAPPLAPTLVESRERPVDLGAFSSTRYAR